ncbi:ABC transporter permease [Mesorhizobium sp. WSM4307]|uniref:ABC transporter permease n=1 Tax=unclassified Mesorhizobium TaxID=325217 RepID=UPI00115E8F58|nr:MULTISPECIES: ABC transporter permease [unclassified Mesorhizobium]TRC72739.1 ABC transporter permease [Mesorhizobium sp. WSM4315]TRC85277.1 ABC transporter permease [Mesorhizobium sp. WSM4307]
MSALLTFLLGNPTLLGIGAAILAALGWGVRQRLAGERSERARQAAAEAAAHDIAGQVQNDIGALPAATARKELKSWAKD